MQYYCAGNIGFQPVDDFFATNNLCFNESIVNIYVTITATTAEQNILHSQLALQGIPRTLKNDPERGHIATKPVNLLNY